MLLLWLCLQFHIAGNSFGGNVAGFVSAGDKAVGITVAADGVEVQRIAAAAFRQGETQIAADAVEIDLIRVRRAADAHFTGNSFAVDGAAARRKRSQGDISADCSEFILLCRKSGTSNIAARGIDTERVHAATHQFHVCRDSLNRDFVQRQGIRQEDGQRLSWQIYAAEKL